MARMARAVLVGVAHHLTQRGLDKRQIFVTEEDFEVYLALVRTNAKRFGAELFGYCLMPNHVHWIVLPQHEAALSRTFGDAHGRYAAYLNTKLGRSGHFWQNRFFSCSMDEAHLWAALRYVERNPVRAGMVDRASSFRWSSAAVHAGIAPRPDWLEAQPMESRFTPQQWDLFLKSDSIAEADIELRKNTYTGRPTGSREFVEWAEAKLGRKLAAQPGGRRQRAITAGEEEAAAQMVIALGE